MSFVYGQYFLLIVLIAFAWGFLVIHTEKSFYTWVKNHWFLKRTAASKLSTLIYLLGIFFLLLSLLDLRGNPTTIESNIPKQKTLI